MKSKPKLPYGLSGGKIISVEDVCSGLACGCFCPHCKQTLVARKGDVNVHHFAHYKSIPCDYAVEVAIHMLVKQILSSADKIRLPKLQIKGWPRSQTITVHEERYVDIDRVYVEKRFHKIIPDIIVESRGHELLVAVFATNKIRVEKLGKIKRAKVACIEINLSKSGILNNKTEIRNKIVVEVDLKSWVYSERAELEKQKVEELKQKVFSKIGINRTYKKVAPRKRSAKKHQVSSWATKAFTCSECGKETRDWTTCDTGKGTCVCHDCFSSISL